MSYSLKYIRKKSCLCFYAFTGLSIFFYLAGMSCLVGVSTQCVREEDERNSLKRNLSTDGFKAAFYLSCVIRA